MNQFKQISSLYYVFTVICSHVCSISFIPAIRLVHLVKAKSEKLICVTITLNDHELIGRLTAIMRLQFKHKGKCFPLRGFEPQFLGTLSHWAILILNTHLSTRLLFVRYSDPLHHLCLVATLPVTQFSLRVEHTLSLTQPILFFQSLDTYGAKAEPWSLLLFLRDLCISV